MIQAVYKQDLYISQYCILASIVQWMYCIVLYRSYFDEAKRIILINANRFEYLKSKSFSLWVKFNIILLSKIFILDLM